MASQASRSRMGLVILVVLAALALGLFTTFRHYRVLRLQYLESGNQIARHLDVLNGQAGNPWQYRVLATYLSEGLIRLFRSLRVEHHIAVSFLFLRAILDTSVFITAFFYYRRFGLSIPHALIGMLLLAWGMSYAYYDSDLQFNTSIDVICYLAAGLAVLHSKPIWLVPIMLLAALNRETSGLIPFLLLVSAAVTEPAITRKVWMIFGASLAIYGVIFVGLRLAFGEQGSSLPYHHYPGLDMLQHNLGRLVTLEQLFAVLSFIPILALIGYRKWPVHLRVFFWVIVPVWLVVHMFAAIMAEGRLFLVPQALVFIPGVLFLAQWSAGALGQTQGTAR